MGVKNCSRQIRNDSDDDGSDHYNCNSIVAVIGSSGGGAATLGHNDPINLLATIHEELCKISILKKVKSTTHKKQGNEKSNDEDNNKKKINETSNNNEKEKSNNNNSNEGSNDDKSNNEKKGEGGGIHKEQEKQKKLANKDQYTSYCGVLGCALYVSLHGGMGLDSSTTKKDPDSLSATLYAVGCSVDHSIIFDDISCKDREDNNNENEVAHHYYHDNIDEPFQVRALFTGTLREVNNICRYLDDKIVARLIVDGLIQGLICISCDPQDVNSASLAAAAKMGIPVAGSGGTSIAKASSLYGINFIGNAGGSVATTPYTKAISFCHALSIAWEGKYSPFLASFRHRAEKKVQPHIRSVLESCLPAFLGVCVVIRVMDDVFGNNCFLGAEDELNQTTSAGIGVNKECVIVIGLRQYALPTACCVIAASSYAPEHGSIALMAASVVAAMSCKGSIIAGIIAGWIVAWMIGRTVFACIRVGLPATMTNIILGGGVGVVVALIMEIFRIPQIFLMMAEVVRIILQSSSSSTSSLSSKFSLFDFLSNSNWSWSHRGVGLVLGCIFCYGSKVGWYHSVFLPLILIEMEKGDPSLLGAIDECALVLVSAGICAANLVLSPKTTPINDGERVRSSSSISKRGLCINILCGDFIEAAYPFMEKSNIVNFGGYLASGLSTEILIHNRSTIRDAVLSSAYLPLPMTIWLSTDPWRMASACSIAFGISFVGGVAGNAWSRFNQTTRRQQEE